jgi:[NiFe] hydrogenase small subunit
MECETEFEQRLEQRGISRRQFLKYCATVAGAIGLGPAFGPKVYAAFATEPRPPVLWLHFAECTGCTEATLRTTSPSFEQLIFDIISLDYHETLMAAAGKTVEDHLFASAESYRGNFFCVVEGAIPTADGGIYGMIGGRTMQSIAEEVCPKAKAIIALGNCASFGGLPAAAPNPTGATGVEGVIGFNTGVPVVNLPGCPPNPINFVGTIAGHLLSGAPPPLDSDGRPLFAYGTRVHDRCPYRHDSNEDKCLEDYGCKGKRCYNNCPTEKFNDATSWPVQAGHPCIGCSEPDFWDVMTPFYRESHDDGHEEEHHGEEEYDH